MQKQKAMRKIFLRVGTRIWLRPDEKETVFLKEFLPYGSPNSKRQVKGHLEIRGFDPTMQFVVDEIVDE